MTTTIATIPQRVNGQLLKRYPQQKVSLIAKVQNWPSPASTRLTLQTSDDCEVTCLMEAGWYDRKRASLIGSNYVEVIAEQIGDDKVKLDAPDHYMIPLGNDLDLNIVNSTTLLMYHPQVRECFQVVTPTSDN